MLQLSPMQQASPVGPGVSSAPSRSPHGGAPAQSPARNQVVSYSPHMMHIHDNNNLYILIFSIQSWSLLHLIFWWNIISMSHSASIYDKIIRSIFYYRWTLTVYLWG